MTTEQIITLAKEKLGKDITEQEAQDYISGKAAIPDEALALVSGSGECDEKYPCPSCGSANTIVIDRVRIQTFCVQTILKLQCQDCGHIF